MIDDKLWHRKMIRPYLDHMKIRNMQAHVCENDNNN